MTAVVAPASPPLTADADQIKAFAEALFPYASKGQRISLRAFYEDRNDSFAIRPMWLGDGLDDVVRMATQMATQAAQSDRPIVFCPPIAGFAPKGGRDEWKAAEQDLNEAFALSVECDANPEAARRKLEQLLGPATVVVASGGEWVEPEFGSVEDKLHLHWRLSEPASGEDLALTKEARRLAAALVGADHSNIPMVHPIRWPGTWHKKKSPRLAQIVTLNASNEIDLHHALAVLRDVVGELPAAQPRQRIASLSMLDGEGDAEEAALVRGIVLGDPGLHDGINRLAAKWIARGMAGGGAVNSLRALMLAVPETDRDERWQARYDDIPRSVSTAQEKYERPPLRVVRDEAELAPAPVARPASSSHQEVPEHLLDVPGLVGVIARWITKTALYPQPLLSLGAALCVIGTAAGRKFAGPTKSGTHLYVLGLAGTGAGKNHPARQAKRILTSADMKEFIGPSVFMSDSSVYQYVSAQPQMVCFMDEFGSYLQKLNAKQGSGHERAISGILRTLWGSSFDTVYPPAWSLRNNSDKLPPIHSPSLSILGLSVHEEFYAALQSVDIANGFLNRFLILSTHRKPPEVEEPMADGEIPAVILDSLRIIAASGYDPKKAKPFKSDQWQADVRLDWASAEVRQAYRAFQKQVQEEGEHSQLLSRVPEMAVRLATIRAIGKGKLTAPVVEMDDITWASELAMWSARRMIADAADYMVESEHQGRANEILRHIKAAPEQRLTLTELNRKVKNKFDARQIRLILEGLADGGLIEVVSFEPNGPGRPTKIAVYRG